jgi:hypothetical protein
MLFVLSSMKTGILMCVTLMLHSNFSLVFILSLRETSALVLFLLFLQILCHIHCVLNMFSLNFEFIYRFYSSMGWQTMNRTLRCVCERTMWSSPRMATLVCQQQQEAWQVCWVCIWSRTRNSYSNRNCSAAEHFQFQETGTVIFLGLSVFSLVIRNLCCNFCLQCPDL